MRIFFWPEKRFGTYCVLFQVTRRVFNNEKVSLVTLPSAARLKMYCVSFSFFFFFLCACQKWIMVPGVPSGDRGNW